MTRDALNRRVRTAPPEPLAKQIVLAPADVDLFAAIAQHGPLPSSYLYEFTRHRRRDWTYLQNRLTELFNGDRQGAYLTNPPQQFATYRGRYQHLVYELAPRAVRVLAERTAVPISRRTDPFVHRLMCACVSSSLRLAAERAGVRYISWDEIRAHRAADAASNVGWAHQVSSRDSIIPDDLFGFEYPNAGYRFFALEIDRNTESINRKNLAQSSFGAKVRAYADMLASGRYRSCWGIPNLTILTVTTSEMHASAILRHVAQKCAYPDRFALAVETGFGSNWRVPERLLDHLFCRTWQSTAGPRDISRP